MINITWLLSEEAWENQPGKRFSQVVCEDGRPGFYSNYIKYKRNVDEGRYVPITTSRGCITASYDGPIIVHGPIRFVNQMLKEHPAFHWVFVTDFKDNLRVSDYMSRFPLEWFLNSDVFFTPFGILKQKKPIHPVFIRPNSPFKIFTGFEVTPENFEQEMSSLVQIQNVQNDEMIMVSSSKDIQSEYRCVIVDGKVSAYSTYQWDDIHDVRRDILPDCLELAEKIAKYSYQLDNAYVVDVCMTESGPKIVEFNSFCSSGMYACDLEKVVSDMNDLALKEWAEGYI